MELEKQCCSLELAKQLKELGVKQESLFIWSGHTTPETLWRFDVWEEADIYEWHRQLSYAAFTVAELGELIMFRNGCVMPPYYEDGEWRAALGYNIHEDTEANARAVMLIELLGDTSK